MMPLEATMKRIATIVIEQTGQDGDWVVPALKLEDMGDSLDMVEVVMAVEQSFGVEIRDDQYSPETTIEQLATMVEELGGSDGEPTF
jgi:acyl carrier protein